MMLINANKIGRDVALTTCAPSLMIDELMMENGHCITIRVMAVIPTAGPVSVGKIYSQFLNFLK